MTQTVYYTADELETAYAQASAHEMTQAWRNALDRAYDLLLASGPITVDMDGFGAITLALIPSQRQPGLNYPVNGTCSCTAGQNGRPCAHRAAKRLLSIASEQAAAKQVRTVEQARTLEADDLFKAEDETPEQAALRVARKRSSVPGPLGTHRDGTPMRVSREQAMREMAELFAD
jgi:hypothetical protein